jgi:hypothetical protein
MLLMFGVSPSLLGQADALGRRFDETVAAAAPGSRAEPTVQSSQGEIRRRWHLADGERLGVRCWVRESPEAAEKFVQELTMVIPVPSSRISGFGSDAYLFAAVGVNRERLLVFQRGRVVVETRIRGEQNAKYFAALFAKEVARAIALGEVEPRQ